MTITCWFCSGDLPEADFPFCSDECWDKWIDMEEDE